MSVKVFPFLLHKTTGIKRNVRLQAPVSTLIVLLQSYASPKRCTQLMGGAQTILMTLTRRSEARSAASLYVSNG